MGSYYSDVEKRLSPFKEKIFSLDIEGIIKSDVILLSDLLMFYPKEEYLIYQYADSYDRMTVSKRRFRDKMEQIIFQIYHDDRMDLSLHRFYNFKEKTLPDDLPIKFAHFFCRTNSYHKFKKIVFENEKSEQIGKDKFIDQMSKVMGLILHEKEEYGKYSCFAEFANNYVSFINDSKDL